MSKSGRGPAPEGAPGILEPFFRDIGPERVLTRSEEQVRTRRLVELRRLEQHLLAGVPFVARVLLRRLRSGSVREAQRCWRAGAAPADLEAIAVELERVLAAMPRLTGQGHVHRRAWDGYEEWLRDTLLSWRLHPDFFDEAGAELRARARAAGSRGGARSEALRDEVGLPLRRLRPRLRELARARARRDEARNELARRNLKLVVSCAKPFRNLGVSFPDLIQEGNLGLLRAIQLFEPERGHKLSTYAVWWIRQSLIRAVQAHGRTVRLPSHVNERLQALGRVEEGAVRRLGRDADELELARSAEVPVERVRELHRVRQPVASLDAPADPERPHTLHDALADRGHPSPQERLEQQHRARLADRLLAHLEPAERELIGRRFGFGSTPRRCATLQELAAEQGISRESMRRREGEVLEKLRRLSGVDAGQAGGSA